MSRRFLPLLLPFLCKSKKQKELEIYLLWEECYCKESKVLGVRDKTMKVTCSSGGPQAEGALEPVSRRESCWLKIGSPRCFLTPLRAAAAPVSSDSPGSQQSSPHICRAQGKILNIINQVKRLLDKTYSSL